MNNPPSGTVTFLFTDIEGSTQLAQQYPRQMPSLLNRHHEILRSAIHSHNGYIFQNEGDSLAVAFHSPMDALNTAFDAQQQLQSEAWSPAPIKVRMGIHTGAAQLNDTSAPTIYTGYTTLATTSRIMSAGHGGQILISGATRELVRDVLPIDSELQDLGEKRLKDLLRPERIYQLNISGFPNTFPPLKTLDAHPNNLPTQLTSFIGRENEISEVKQELAAHRLVTLTGSGGTGKTRLSLQVAADLLDKFDHGVWFVELAPLTDPDLIPQAILSTIGVQEQQGKTSLEVLKEYLDEKQTLILLDNCEHLISASAHIANVLLGVAPKLEILASSREALGVKGEVSYPVPSLSLPDIKNLPIIEQLSQYEAVRLFIDRALLVAPHFVVDKDNAPHIAQICNRLDGIPLAIELAAARIKMLSVEQISKRLDDRFRFLTGGARTALPRQQTLRALIDWSYDLLSENERLLLCRLSVFAGGWTMEAAEEVCVGQDDILPYDILDLLTQLVNKSLVVVVENSQSGETRYRMLETIRQYTREKLLEAGGSESLRDQHLTHFVKLVEQAEPELYRSNQIFWLNRLEDEVDNLRLALEWAVASNVRAGLKIASIPWRFWGLRGNARELGDWLERLLKTETAMDALYAQALVSYAFSRFNLGDIPEALRLAEQSLQLARAISDKRMEAFSLSFLGGFNVLQGKVGAGSLLLEESLTLYQSLSDEIGQINALGWLTTNSGDFERPSRITSEFLHLSREVGDLASIATSLIRMARFAMWRGDFVSPVPWLEEALALARRMDDRSNEEEALSTYGVLSYWLGDYQRAIVFYEEAIRLGEQTGNLYQNFWAQFHMTYAILGQGDLQRARERFMAGIANTYKANFLIALVYNMEGLASLLVQENQPTRSVQLFAWADTMRGQLGDQRPPVEQARVERDLALIHSILNDNDFTRLSVEGRTMTLEQAIALALET
ncbi:MAG TPA: adenylate/guanylate cyclase domain-containing protein [Anaerolineales bacterium]|nr:adenylate/guanylate cyclase domain-containing protein [Anaerolineales bacterium]